MRGRMSQRRGRCVPTEEGASLLRPDSSFVLLEEVPYDAEAGKESRFLRICSICASVTETQVGDGGEVCVR